MPDLESQGDEQDRPEERDRPGLWVSDDDNVVLFFVGGLNQADARDAAL